MKIYMLVNLKKKDRLGLIPERKMERTKEIIN